MYGPLKNLCHLQIMEIQKIVEEMVEPWSNHAANIAILVRPSKDLFADYGVNRGKFWNIGIIDILAFLHR